MAQDIVDLIFNKAKELEIKDKTTKLFIDFTASMDIGCDIYLLSRTPYNCNEITYIDKTYVLNFDKEYVYIYSDTFLSRLVNKFKKPYKEINDILKIAFLDIANDMASAIIEQIKNNIRHQYTLLFNSNVHIEKLDIKNVGNYILWMTCEYDELTLYKDDEENDMVQDIDRTYASDIIEHYKNINASDDNKSIITLLSYIYKSFEDKLGGILSLYLAMAK